MTVGRLLDDQDGGDNEGLSPEGGGLWDTPRISHLKYSCCDGTSTAVSLPKVQDESQSPFRKGWCENKHSHP